MTASDIDQKPPTLRKTRRGGRNRSNVERETRSVVHPGLPGGAYRPFTDVEAQRVHGAVLNVMENVGLGEAPDFVVDRITSNGGIVNNAGRLTFPRALVEDVIASARRDVVLHGQKSGCELDLSGTNVHVGSGGAAPSMIDIDTGVYRDATLRDLYDAARMVDALDNLHFFVRSVVARDMPTPRDLDINTAYACLRGTAKHVFVSASAPEHVASIADMCATVAGSETAFRDKPFLSVNINHVVPPLRFDPTSCAVMEQCVRHGIPFQINSFDQAGASSPASLTGSVVQTLVECLAGLVFAWCIDPQAQGILGPRTLIADLRTGALTGGSGEQAVATAASIQMCNYYDLPNSCIAGGTDAKLPDAQSGYEKAHAVALAAHAGCNVISQACGMQASLMGCAHESYVIDNDMLGAIMRSVRGMDVSEETLAEEVMASVVAGEGHFLGNPDTFARMTTDYLYPEIADRQSVSEWQDAGGLDIRARAIAKAKDILTTHHPSHLGADVDAALRNTHDILLPAQLTS